MESKRGDACKSIHTVTRSWAGTSLIKQDTGGGWRDERSVSAHQSWSDGIRKCREKEVKQLKSLFTGTGAFERRGVLQAACEE